MPVPLLILSDSPTSPTGLGREARELAFRIHRDMQDVFRVATFGYGGVYSRALPFEQYQIAEMTNWVPLELPRVWSDFAGKEKGVVFSIWNAAWLPWMADPEMLSTGDLKTLLKSGRFKKWGYFPVDAEGPNERLPLEMGKIFRGFDRVLAYTEWAAGVIERSVAVSGGLWFGMHECQLKELVKNCDCKGWHCRVCNQRFKGLTLTARDQAWTTCLPEYKVEWLPHGTDENIFYPRPKKEARESFINRLTGKNGVLHDNMLMIGVIATNSPRKDWGLAMETCAELVRRGERVGVWAHTDAFKKNWDLPMLVNEFGLTNRVIFTNEHISDEDMAWAYSACDVTLGIGSGEGWGLPLSESLACGTPVVHGDYAGGTAFVPEAFLVKPRAWRWDGYYSNRRPVFKMEDWADQVQINRGASGWLEDEFYWKNCWPRWQEWLRRGVEDFG